MPTHVALLRGVNNLGSKKVAMAELREVVVSLGHADVRTYIQSGNVLFTPRLPGSQAAGADAVALAAELEQAIADGIGVRARAVVLSHAELAGGVRANPFAGETNPRLLHAVFLPEVAGPGMAAWVADAERQVRAAGSRDRAQVLGRTVYLHTPDGYPRSLLRRVLARTGGPTSAAGAGTARNWATVSKLLDLCVPDSRPEQPEARATRSWRDQNAAREHALVLDISDRCRKDRVTAGGRTGGFVNLSSQLIQRVGRLPPPLTRRVTVHRGLRVPMRDGVMLLADRWAPQGANGSMPTALVRTPYGRRGPLGGLLGRALAERGFQVLVQSTRGTFGSGGVFDPMRREREDGLATLDWVREQPWFGGSIVLTGPSYLGYVQWAMAGQFPPEVKAMIPTVTESALTLEFLRADGLSLETPFGWGVMIAGQERRGALLRQLVLNGKVQRALRTSPLGRADMAAIGRRSDYIQDVLAYSADTPRWAVLDHRDQVAQVTVPVSSIGGWYDIFLPGQLADYQILQSAGRPARLTVGPWTHASPGVFRTSMRETLGFGLAYARGEEPAPRAPVRLYVMGEEAWRDFDSWPPRGYTASRFHLRPGGALAAEPPTESPPDRYRYDPADPTPAVGGVRLSGKAGRVDNADLEARADVLTYTTVPLAQDTEVIGDVSAEIWFRSSLSFADVFVRLCDVDPRGRSRNVCDGLVSLSGASEISCAAVRLWPTAHRFRKGHRIRVQVSSGAFPRYARNPGTGEPHASAARLRAADQEVHHDPARPSAVILPVRQAL